MADENSIEQNIIKKLSQLAVGGALKPLSEVFDLDERIFICDAKLTLISRLRRKYDVQQHIIKTRAYTATGWECIIMVINGDKYIYRPKPNLLLQKTGRSTNRTATGSQYVTPGNCQSITRLIVLHKRDETEPDVYKSRDSVTLSLQLLK